MKDVKDGTSVLGNSACNEDGEDKKFYYFSHVKSDDDKSNLAALEEELGCLRTRESPSPTSSLVSSTRSFWPSWQNYRPCRQILRNNSKKLSICRSQGAPVPKDLFTTEKRRFNRICGFLAFCFTILLIFSSLLDVSWDASVPISTQSVTFYSPDNTLVYYKNEPLPYHRQHRKSSKHSFNHSLKPMPYQKMSSKGPIRKFKRLPQCIIIGARKCGTRALIDMLNIHPQVEKAATEIHFFDRDDNYAKGLEWYKQQMPEVFPDQLSIEKSPSYFVTPEVPERIHEMNHSIKLLLIVREPVTRVVSDYTQIYGTNPKHANGSKSPKLEELVLQPDGSVNVHYKAVRISIYSRYFKRWLDIFSPSQIHVVDGDALIRDPYPQLREVEKFLELHPRLSRDNFYFNATKGFYCWKKLEQDLHNETSLHCLNDSKGRRHPPLNRHVVAKLRRFYNHHNKKFYEMVGRDFGWPEN